MEVRVVVGQGTPQGQAQLGEVVVVQEEEDKVVFRIVVDRLYRAVRTRL